MTDGSPTHDATAPAPGPEPDLRPGPLAWGVIVLGWIVMAVAVVGAFTADRIGNVWSWTRWLVGAAVVHDLVLLPLVLGAGWLLTRVAPVAWRVPLRTALVVAGVTALTVWPIARRWGARPDNPTVLPLPVARNLTIVVVALLVPALAAGAVAAWRDRAATHREPEDPS